jgi:hypothetical protein
VYGHKVILVARCSYFASMFSSSMIESNQPEIQLEGPPTSTFLLFLEYLYTDSIPQG